MQNTQQVIFACLAGIALLPGSASCHEPTVNVLIDILRDRKAPSSALVAFESFVRTLFLAVNSNPEIGIALAIQNRNAIGFHGVLVGVTLKLHCFLFLLFFKNPPSGIPSRLFEFQDAVDLAAVISRYGPSTLRASALTHLVDKVVMDSRGTSRIKALLILSRYSLVPEDAFLVESLSETVTRMIKV